MRQFIDKLTHLKPSTSPQASQIPSPPSSFADEQDIFRYRKQRGVNLGSWFVLERWITDSPFRSAVQPAQSDLDVARGKDAKAILENHWNTWITEADWVWLKDHGFNAVRIPIGYYHLAGLDPSLLDGTDFYGLAGVFEHAWSKIKEAFELAYKYRIGILLDLHAAPGKQNADSHSGTSKSPPTLFSSKHNLRHTTHVLSTLLIHLNTYLYNTHSPPLPNLIGIELLNEPHPSSDKILQTWYLNTIHQLRSIDSRVPIYLGECWRLDSYSNWLVHNDRHMEGGLTVLDHHLYRCFTSEDIHTPALSLSQAIDPATNGSTHQHFSSISQKLSNAGGSGLVVGEWSGALNPGSLSGSTTNGFNETKSYVDAQLRLYESQACAGWFFWTYKKGHPGDSGWSLRDAVKKGTFPHYVGIQSSSGRRMDGNEAAVVDAKMKTKAIARENHTSYWSQFRGSYNHSQFDEGYSEGWDTAFHFFNSSFHKNFDEGPKHSVNEPGFGAAWAKKHCSAEDRSKKSYWEYDHGFRQGIDGARGFLIDHFK
ncbi:hypothetical protein AGABI1DRAFT_69695 [Agaricus bisporus var. burnettii JB137-S8]|uniref:Glycoside hydrolase family 5 domain-containing protein n=1 Tax=Agaricus bisporus var. burnettii (strain JB137-S8 / ATCC MYA-4627 / FGSC 10392) TaxID=597362 RepID=K5W3U3_AGABU|nr:uncharacterized protein AGABI1DRAFT_69695 [Agaricus bisporus var. burnettii JB137-S8]EKM81464.1 hypothetical protein AGABI1DRAFT_69695 [Agaricus bisporus var. burnettii JB137-S8]